jgi:hypothetical protein
VKHLVDYVLLRHLLAARRVVLVALRVTGGVFNGCKVLHHLSEREREREGA